MGFLILSFSPQPVREKLEIRSPRPSPAPCNRWIPSVDFLELYGAQMFGDFSLFLRHCLLLCCLLFSLLNAFLEACEGKVSLFNQ